MEVRVVVDAAALHVGHDEVPGESDGVPVLLAGVALRDAPPQCPPDLLVRLLPVGDAEHDAGDLQIMKLSDRSSQGLGENSSFSMKDYQLLSILLLV